jgi:hypothetical protein
MEWATKHEQIRRWTDQMDANKTVLVVLLEV